MPTPKPTGKSLRVIPRWLKSHPLVISAGIVATLFGLITSGFTFVGTVTKVVGLPACFTYADVYHHATGRFGKEGLRWIEHPPFDGGSRHFIFQETHREPEYIYLLNQTPRDGPSNTMLLRLPVCGGTAQWSYQNPQHWVDLYFVWR